MIDIYRDPPIKYFYHVDNDGTITKMHITRYGRYNQVLANPVNVLPGRSSRWFDNDENMFETEKQARRRQDEICS